MSSTAEQAYLNARVSVMSTRLLDPARIATAAEQGLEELAEGFGLPQLLDDNLSARGKSRAVEQALIQTLIAELTVLVRPMKPPQRALVLAWGRLFALTNLKTLIRGRLYDLDRDEIRANLYDLPPNVRLPLADQELLGTENVLELLRRLEEGQYRLIALQAREIYEQRHEPFALEAAIDKRYLADLARHVTQFHDANLRPLQQLVGALIDHADLLWLLRFRFSYGLSPSETFYQLVPSFRLMNRERLLSLVNAESIEQVIADLPTPLSDLLEDSANLIDVQKRMGTHLYLEALRILRHGRSGVARALAYLILRRMDQMLLFSLIQGGLLQLPRDLVHIAIELAEPVCPLDSGASMH